MPVQFANNFSTKLATSLNTVQVEADITSGDGAVLQSKLPNTISATDPVRLTLVRKSGGVETAWEVIEVTSRSTDTLTFTRGLSNEGTPAISWSVGEDIEARFTRGLAESLRATAGVLTQEFESTEIVVLNNTSFNIAHGFGVEPKLVQFYLVCKSAELGYSVGDVILYNDLISIDGQSSRFAAVTVDATNVNIRFANSPNEVWVVRKDNGVIATSSQGAFNLKFKAYA